MRITQRLPREAGREYALRTLIDNIIHLDLIPGIAVSENELGTEMGLSRTPVREALMELAKVKIVEIYPQRGSVISLIDYDLVEESQFMRKVLECAVVEHVCDVITPQTLNILSENMKLQNYHLQNQSYECLWNLDNQFHQAMFDIANKAQINVLISNFSIHFNRVRNMSLHTVKNLKIVQDHEEIFDAIKQKNPSLAHTKMEEHLNRYKFDAAEIYQKYPMFVKK